MKKLLACSFILGSLLLLFRGVAKAETFIFDGGGADSLLSTAANWSPDGVPGSGVAPSVNFFDVIVVRAANGKRALLEAPTEVTAFFFTIYGGPDVIPLVKDGFDMTGGKITLVGTGQFEFSSNEQNIDVEVNMSGGELTANLGLVLGGRTGGLGPLPTYDSVFNMSGDARAIFPNAGAVIGLDDPSVANAMATLNMTDNAVLEADFLGLSPNGNSLVTLADNAKIVLDGDRSILLNNAIADGFITGSLAPTFDGSFTTLMADPAAAVDESDFNGNGFRDGADFIIWQQNHGAIGTGTPATGDANGDTNVDGLDLAIWEGQFGTPAPLLAAVLSVPEPTTGCLALITFTLLGCGARRRVGR